MSAKAQRLAEDLRTDLARRFATVSSVLFDPADLMPYIQVGTGAIGSQSALVKVLDVVSLGTDVIGHPNAGYGNPTKIFVAEETSTIAATPLLTAVNQITLLGCVMTRGARVELFLSANGTAADLTHLVVGNKVATFDPDLKYKLQSQM